MYVSFDLIKIFENLLNIYDEALLNLLLVGYLLGEHYWLVRHTRHLVHKRGTIFALERQL